MRGSDVVAGQIRRLRTSRGITASQLAQRCQELGASSITTNVIANIETRRRDVSVDDLLVFALALDVPPLHLLSPAPAGDTKPGNRADPSAQGPASFAVTGTAVIEDPVVAHRWLQGHQALPGSQEHLYYAAAHADARHTGTATTPSPDAGTRLAAQFDREAANFVSTVRAQVDGLLTGLETAVASGDSPDDVLTTLTQARARLTSPPASAGTRGEQGDSSNT